MRLPPEPLHAGYAGGISVAMPTAIPVVPLSKMVGRRAGSIFGSSKCCVEVWNPVSRPRPSSLNSSSEYFDNRDSVVTHYANDFDCPARPSSPDHQPADNGRERLRHQDHRFITGDTAVRMVFLPSTSPTVRADFLNLALAFRPSSDIVHNAALNRFQTITNKMATHGP